MRVRNVSGNVVKVDTSHDATRKLVLRGRRAIADYYDCKYLLYKEIYEHGSVS
ncbi:MAG: hypothetical protein J1G04_07275 [Clostridiales bacterium]|nr:hypothetical protein [Clostridiales bacterium]